MPSTSRPPGRSAKRSAYGPAPYLADRLPFMLAYALGVSAASAVAFLSPAAGISGAGASATIDVAYAALVAASFLAAWLAFDYRRASRLPAAAARAVAEGPEPGYSAALPEPASREQAIWKESSEALERALVALRGEADARGRAFSDYLVSWAHEAKTPLAAAMLELESPGVPPAIRDSVREELERAVEGVERVLYSARADSFSRDYLVREVDPLAIVRAEVAARARAFVKAGVSFSVEPWSGGGGEGSGERPGAGPTVRSDPKWLAFAVRQVLSNALKYTPRGGRVVARLSREGGDTVLSIRDTGRGVPPEDLPRIFDRGFTGANGRDYPEATGMGLYIVARLCEGMGHQVSADSEPGAYTDIRIRFGPPTDYLRPLGGGGSMAR